MCERGERARLVGSFEGGVGFHLGFMLPMEEVRGKKWRGG